MAQPFLLTDAPASAVDRRLAAGAVATLAAVVVAAPLLPDAPLEASAPLVPAYAAAVLIVELLTAALLAGLYAVRPAPAVLVLAAGYIFAGLTVVPWALTFPGLLPNADGLLQATAAIAAVRRLAFPLFVIGYVLLRHRPDSTGPAGGAIAATVAAAAAAAALLAIAALHGDDLLPPFMRDARNVAPAWSLVPPAALLLYAAAFVLLWRARRSVLDLWLLVVVATLAAELVMLSYVAGGTRLSLGWWTGRLCGLVSASVVLLVLLAGTTTLYARLARALLAERRSRESRLAAMEALSAAVAHEVNQPVAGMVTNADAALRWLSRVPPDLDETRAALERIAADGHRTGRLVGNLRLLFRPGGRTLRPVDPTAAVRAATARCGEDAALSRVALTVRIGPLPAVLADPDALEIALSNIVANAIDAAAAGPTRHPAVAVDAREADGAAEIAVADNGPGVPEAERERIFTPFHTTKPGGLGMGLLIARQAVEAGGGRIAVEDAPGGGALFRVTLPAAVGSDLGAA